jgi:hypothetical protein
MASGLGGPEERRAFVVTRDAEEGHE